jgi:hypothetical protein
MEEKNLQSWDAFESEVERLAEFTEKKKRGRLLGSGTIFRGQSDSKWPLETTLERAVGEKQRLTAYYGLISRIKDRIETFTGKSWKIPEISEFNKILEHYSSMRRQAFPIKLVRYMVYLRHHGFPSPLLDWTRSPYIAAYFAFRDFHRREGSVAIYAYIEHFGIKAGREAGPYIKTFGPYIRSDKRHFLQQCEYTVCTGIENSEPCYLKHDAVFLDRLTLDNRQDLLYKFTLPIGERKHALRRLELYNINAFSLFGSTDSLMESVFVHETYAE